jgi:glycosyltransferase involved in cell wall biosynthesis
LYFIDSVSNYRSGVHASVLQTCTIMRQNGNQVTLIGANENNSLLDFENLNVIGFSNIGPKSLNLLVGLRRWLKLNLNNYDLVSIETIWSFSNYFIVKACKKYNIPYVITTHGMLHPEALKVSSFKKKIAKNSILKSLFKNAIAFHALNSHEKQMIEKYDIKTKIFIIGNGINLPYLANNYLFNGHELYGSFINKNYCLYLGRLHPIKGVDRLIEAWTKMNYNNNWHLVIAGDGDATYESYLKTLYNPTINDNISFVGFVTKQNKDFLYQNASFSILPSHSEAFPMAILESFSYSKPALITTACVFEEALKWNAVIQVESSNDGIYVGLNHFISKNDHEINEMGQNGLKLVQREFLWDAIYKKLIYEYTLLLRSNNLKTN